MGRCYIAQERIATLRRLLPNAEAFVAAAVARKTEHGACGGGGGGDGGATSIAAVAARGVGGSWAASGSGSIVGATAAVAACGGGCSSGGGGEMADLNHRKLEELQQRLAEAHRQLAAAEQQAAAARQQAVIAQQQAQQQAAAAAAQVEEARRQQAAAQQQATAAVAEQEVKHQQLRILQGELRRMDEAGLPMARMIPPERLRLGRRLEGGGQGEVYMAELLPLDGDGAGPAGVQVAVKIVRVGVPEARHAYEVRRMNRCNCMAHMGKMLYSMHILRDVMMNA